MAEFCTLADMEALLQVTVPAEKLASATAAIVEARAAIQAYTGQVLEAVEDDEISFDGAGGVRILLPELPVTEVATVLEDDEALVVDDDYKLGQHGILHRIGGRWASGVQNIVVTYSHGYATIPQIIADVCARAAARRYQAGLRASESDAVPGVQAKSLGDFSVTFAGEGGGAGEGTLGASAAPMLLRSEKESLDRFRV